MRMQSLSKSARFALLCGCLVLFSGESFAQRERDLRVPGRTGDRVRTSESPSEKQKKEGAASDAAAATETADLPARLTSSTTIISSDREALRNDFKAARATYNKLQWKQFIAARLLEKYMEGSGQRSVNVSAQDLIRGLANRKSFRDTLKSEGFERAEIDKLIGKLEEDMKELGLK